MLKKSFLCLLLIDAKFLGKHIKNILILECLLLLFFLSFTRFFFLASILPSLAMSLTKSWHICFISVSLMMSLLSSLVEHLHDSLQWASTMSLSELSNEFSCNLFCISTNASIFNCFKDISQLNFFIRIHNVFDFAEHICKSEVSELLVFFFSFLFFFHLLSHAFIFFFIRTFFFITKIHLF